MEVEARPLEQPKRRKAFVFGCSGAGPGNYPTISQSAKAIKSQLTYHKAKGKTKTKNFEVELWRDEVLTTYDVAGNKVPSGKFGPLPYTRKYEVVDAIKNFFSGGNEEDLALFYYIGHGDLDGQTKKMSLYIPKPNGGHFTIAMNDLLQWAQDSPIGNIIIVLDCCYSGAIGKDFGKQIRPGISILTSASNFSEAYGEDCYMGNYTLFTDLFKRALMGRIGDRTGVVSLASIYHYICLSLGTAQQPALRCNADLFIPIKYCKADFDDLDAALLYTCFESNDVEQWGETSRWLSAYTLRSDLEPEVQKDLIARLPLLYQRGYVLPKNATNDRGEHIETWILDVPGRRIWDMVNNGFLTVE